MNWEEIIKSIGIVGIISGLIVWLIKQLGQQLINKNLKSFEQKLNEKTELFKKDLQFISEKASKLHIKRLEKIETIYSLLIDFNMDMETLVSWKMVTGMSEDEIEKQNLEDVKKASKTGNEFFVYYSKNRLYFNEETCEIIDEIIKKLKSSYAGFSFKYMFLNLSDEIKIEQVKKATNLIRNEVPELKIKLEKNFREILGVK